MKKEFTLALASTTVTLLVALGLIRWLAPGLIGIAPDLQLVQVTKKVPPFYENVFRSEDRNSPKFILNDPYTVTRLKPLFPDEVLMGPNDILGFRNRSVPNIADIITIGDSQTYGNNATLELAWPIRMGRYIPGRPPVIYNMSAASWGGPHYLEIFEKALFLRPRAVVVAFYSGNDPIESFMGAYGSDRWKDLKLDGSLSKEDVPEVEFPAPPSAQWPVEFKGGSSTVFTPALRLASNSPDSPVVRTGYRILVEVARRIEEKASSEAVPVIFTIIPTKELVYAKRVYREGLTPPDVYKTLVEEERKNIERMAALLKRLKWAEYVDVLSPLEESAMARTLYLPNEDGHPTPDGYDVIAETVASALVRHLPPHPRGLLALKRHSGVGFLLLADHENYRYFSISRDLLLKNGWKLPEKVKVLDPRDLAGMTFAGMISTVDPDKYGPGAFGE